MRSVVLFLGIVALEVPPTTFWVTDVTLTDELLTG